MKSRIGIAPVPGKIQKKRRNLSKNELIQECLELQPSVFLKRVKVPANQAHHNMKTWKRHLRPFLAIVKIEKLNWKQEAERECRVVPCRVEMEEIRYAELKVTRHSPGTREIDYKLEAEDYEKTLRYEDLFLETIPAIPKLTNQPKPESRSSLGGMTQVDNFSLRLPHMLTYIFKVHDYKGDMSSIVWVLAGRGMYSDVLDAYLTLKLDDVKSAAILQTNNKQMKITLTRQKFQYLPVNFLLSFDQLKEDCHYGKLHNFLQVETFVKENYPKYCINKNTILISPICTKRHFYLAVFYFSEHVILIFDSAWRYFPNTLRVQNVRDVLNYLLLGNPNLCKPPEKWEIKFADCAQQTDDYNCGCYVIKFIEYQLNGVGLSEKCYQQVLSKEEIVEIRRKIVTKLLPTTKVGSQLLQALME